MMSMQHVAASIFTSFLAEILIFQFPHSALWTVQGSEYWQWDELKYNDLSVYPKPLSKLLTGVPSGLDAALTWTNGKIFVFKGDDYWRVNNRLSVDKGYPLSKKQRWMRCQGLTIRGQQALRGLQQGSSFHSSGINSCVTSTLVINCEASVGNLFLFDWMCGYDCIQASPSLQSRLIFVRLISSAVFVTARIM